MNEKEWNDVQQELIETSLLSGMYPMVTQRRNGDHVLYFSNTKNNVFITPEYRTDSVAMNVVNLCKASGLSFVEHVGKLNDVLDGNKQLVDVIKELKSALISKYKGAEIETTDAYDVLDADEDETSIDASEASVEEILPVVDRNVGYLWLLYEKGDTFVGEDNPKTIEGKACESAKMAVDSIKKSRQNKRARKIIADATSDEDDDKDK